MKPSTGRKALPGNICSAQPSLQPKPGLGQGFLLPTCKVGAEGRAQGVAEQKKLQLCSFHTIPMAGRYLDSLLLSSAGDK